MLEKIVELKAEERLWSVDWYHLNNHRHPSGKMLATVGESKTIKLWTINSDKKWALQVTLSDPGDPADVTHQVHQMRQV